MHIFTHGYSRHCPENHHTAIITHDINSTILLDYYQQQLR